MLERTVSAIAKLTQKQSRFVDEYLIDLNETQAAIRAGYSRKTAHAIGSENLKKPEIKKQIDRRLQEIKSARTADATEVLETLTAIMRGEMTEEVPLLCGDGCQELSDKNTAVKDRLKAAELLGKRYRLFDGDEPTEQPADAPFDLPARLIAPSFAAVHLDVLEGTYTEYVLGGGRGSTKSSFISLEVINLIKNNPDMNALVLRKVGNTLRGSVFAQILWAIGALGLADEFEATVSPMEITRKATGQKILFRGADDPLKLKSVKPVHGYIGIVWFEELDQFAGDEECRSIQQSAIRGGDKAYIFKSFNPPKTKSNWANQYIEVPKDKRLVSHSDYRSVPAKWLGKTFLDEAEYLKATNPAAYEHEYLGIPNGNGGMVFENAVAETITDEQIVQFDRVLNGLDWGYYPDPWAFNRCYFDAARRTLYIFDELHAPKKATAKPLICCSHTALLLTTASRQTARNQEHCRLQELRLLLPRGGDGSRLSRVFHEVLQSLVRIVVDPVRCPETWAEFSQYEYERTKDGEIISGYPDANNHHIDAVRYATEQIWKRRGQ